MKLLNDEEQNEKKREKQLIKSSLIQMGILLALSLIGIYMMLMILFIIIRNLPGSPYLMELSEFPSQYLINLWGLDKTPFQQFLIFLENLFSGNWGESLTLSQGTPVKLIFLGAYSQSLELNFIAFCFSLIFVVIFVKRALKFKNKKLGLILQVIKRLNWAIFILGVGWLLQYTFGYTLKLLPTTNYYSQNISDIPQYTHFRLINCLLTGNLTAFWDTIQHLIMPVFCLSFIMFSFITELVYSIIDYYKNQKKFLFLSGKIGFYLSLIITANLLLDPTFHLNAIGMLTLDSIHRGDFFILGAIFYRTLHTFFILNISINFILLLIRFIMESVKKSKIDHDEAESTISPKSLLSDSSSNSPEPIPDLTIAENSLVLDKNDENKESIDNERFRNLKRHRINPLIILGIILILMVLIFAIFAKWIAPYDYELVSGSDTSVEAFAPPSNEHIFGVTILGRDVFSRCLYGIKTTVKVGFISTIIGMPIGVIMGLISAFFGKWVKYIIDIISGFIFLFSGLLFAYCMISIVGNDFTSIYWILGLSILPIATLFTQQAISYEMKMGDIIPCKLTKTNGRKILNRLPSIFMSILGVGCLIMGFVILFFESVNWLGLGDLSIISLGTDINLAAYKSPTSPWASFWPMFWTYITALGFMMLGIGLKKE